MPTSQRPVGTLLRDWRRRRRLSQLDLAGDAETSTRHLSFVETGRAQPSRAMLLRLAARLQLSLRDRNALLMAGGFAPVFPERGLDDPALAAVQRALALVLAGHEPYPALAIDRHWTLLTANRAVAPLLATVSPELMEPPVNLLRLTLHPEGIASRIVNWSEWRAHLLQRVSRQQDLGADPVLAALLDEVRAYPPPAEAPSSHGDPGSEVAAPLRLRCKYGVLSLLSTTMIFGAPGDVTVAELAIESFFPADQETGELLKRIAETWAEAGG